MGDHEGVATLEAMEAEHAEVDPLLESCAVGFGRLAAEADRDARDALEVRVVALRDRLGHHLAHEERGSSPHRMSIRASTETGRPR
jgi:hypothetical protein